MRGSPAPTGHSLINTDLARPSGQPSNPHIGNRTWHTISLILTTQTSMPKTCGPLRKPMTSDTVSFSSSPLGAQHAGYSTIWKLGKGKLLWTSQTAMAATTTYQQSSSSCASLRQDFLRTKKLECFRAGLGFFKFTPRRGERFEVWFPRLRWCVGRGQCGVWSWPQPGIPELDAPVAAAASPTQVGRPIEGFPAHVAQHQGGMCPVAAGHPQGTRP